MAKKTTAPAAKKTSGDSSKAAERIAEHFARSGRADTEVVRFRDLVQLVREGLIASGHDGE